jgi:lipopolysaccharide transport system ATP-binding protein
MSNTVISVENLSKFYRLGQIGTGRLADDFKIWWAKKRGKSNPFLKIGEIDHGNRDDETFWALRDVSFAVEQGETLGIIGRNGAGKSTLLKILSQVTAPSSGLVKIKGRIASLLEVGTGFHPDLTGRENTYLNGAILGMTRQEVRRKLDEIVAFAEIEQFLDTPIKRYSSGMFVRLAFAVAAHLDPEILIVDEVLAVGDTEFQKKCLGKMSDVAGEGRTVLFVSHNMASVKSLCQNGILLSKGCIVYKGTAEEAIEIYLENKDNFDQEKDLMHFRTKKEPEIIRKILINESPEWSVPKINIGADVKIRLFLQKEHFLERIHIGIGFDNEMRERIFTVSTINQDEKINFSTNQIIVDCNIRKVNLAPGKYFLKIAISDISQSYDTIESYPGFEIIPSDYFGTGKLPNKSQGVLIMNAQWKKINE